MILDDTNIKILEKAVERLGVTRLCATLGISNSAYYIALKRGRGFTPDVWCKIVEIAKAKEMPGNGPSVALEPPQGITRSDTAAECQLLSTWLQELSKDELIKVIAFVAGLRERRND